MERNRNYSKTIVLIYFLLTMTTGCMYPKSKFGPEANAKRKEIGMETLPESWKPMSVGDNYTIWKNPFGDSLLKENKSLYFSKSISYDEKNELISEEDLYYSGLKFLTIDGQQMESLSINYYFKSQKLGDLEVKGWYCSYTGPLQQVQVPYKSKNGKTYLGGPFVISLAKADSLLRKWRLEPPQRPTND